MNSISPVMPSFGMNRRSFVTAGIGALALTTLPKRARAQEYDQKHLDDNAVPWAKEVEALKALAIIKDEKDAAKIVLKQPDFEMAWRRLTHLAEVCGKINWHFTNDQGYLKSQKISEIKLDQLNQMADKSKKKIMELGLVGDLGNNLP